MPDDEDVIRRALYGWPERLPDFGTERRARIVAQMEGLVRQWNE